MVPLLIGCGSVKDGPPGGLCVRSRVRSLSPVLDAQVRNTRPDGLAVRSGPSTVSFASNVLSGKRCGDEERVAGSSSILTPTSGGAGAPGQPPDRYNPTAAAPVMRATRKPTLAQLKDDAGRSTI